MGLLKLDGYELVSDPANSDFVVVNTCGFIEQARKESYAAIDEMLELKRSGQTKGVIVSGCLAERQKEEMLEERPDIDSLVGVLAAMRLPRLQIAWWVIWKSSGRSFSRLRFERCRIPGGCRSRLDTLRT